MNAKAKGRIYGAATVGERGQVVIPVGIRRQYNISPGDKLIVFAKPDMIGLVRAEEFSRFLNEASAAVGAMGNKTRGA